MGEFHDDMDDNRPCFFKLIFGGVNTEHLVILYPFVLCSWICKSFMFTVFWRVVLYVLEINKLLLVAVSHSCLIALTSNQWRS